MDMLPEVDVMIDEYQFFEDWCDSVDGYCEIKYCEDEDPFWPKAAGIAIAYAIVELSYITTFSQHTLDNAVDLLAIYDDDVPDVVDLMLEIGFYTMLDGELKLALPGGVW
jgi:hypothetical protein